MFVKFARHKGDVDIFDVATVILKKRGEEMCARKRKMILLFSLSFIAWYKVSNVIITATVLVNYNRAFTKKKKTWPPRQIVVHISQLIVYYIIYCIISSCFPRQTTRLSRFTACDGSRVEWPRVDEPEKFYTSVIL